MAVRLALLVLVAAVTGCLAVPGGVPVHAGNGWAGDYRGRFDGDVLGVVTISELGGSLDVAIEAASIGCNGQIAFSAPVPQGRKLVRTLPFDPERPSPDGFSCVMTLTRHGDRLTVAEDKCDVYHGAACAFEGVLSR